MRTFTNIFALILVLAATVLIGCDTVGDTGLEEPTPPQQSESPVTLGVTALPSDSGVSLSWSISGSEVVTGTEQDPMRTVIERRSIEDCVDGDAANPGDYANVCDDFSKIAVIEDGSTSYSDDVPSGEYEYRVEVEFANSTLNTSTVTTVRF